MISPFQYPRFRLYRRLSPGPFKRYQQYKPALQQEFENKCIYCRIPDSVRGYNGFGVEHYRPKTLFPELTTAYPNLFYCCNQCNNRKGAHWREEPRERVPNPCDDEMHKHVRFFHGSVNSHSPSGRVLVDLLDLNDPKLIRLREVIDHTLALCSSKLTELDAAVKRISAQQPRTPKHDEAIAKLEAARARVQTTIDFWMGR